MMSFYGIDIMFLDTFVIKNESIELSGFFEQVFLIIDFGLKFVEFCYNYLYNIFIL